MSEHKPFNISETSQVEKNNPNYYDLLNKSEEFPIQIHEKIWERDSNWNENLISKLIKKRKK